MRDGMAKGALCGAASASMAAGLSGWFFGRSGADVYWRTWPLGSFVEGALKVMGQVESGNVPARHLALALVVILASAAAGVFVGSGAPATSGSAGERTAKLAAAVAPWYVAVLLAGIGAVLAPLLGNILLEDAAGLLLTIGIWGAVAAMVLLPFALVSVLLGLAILEGWTRQPGVPATGVGRRAVRTALLIGMFALGAL